MLSELADVEMYDDNINAQTSVPGAASLSNASEQAALSGQIRDEQSASAEAKSAKRIDASALRARSTASFKEDANHEYGHFFRRLQIKPKNYERFFLGIVRVIRNKHLADLKRATDKSIKSLTRVLLRGYGKIVWGKTAGEWLIDQRELNRGERRLEYFNTDATHDERFFDIMEEMWLKMRDILFEEKPTPKKRGPMSKPGTHSQETAENDLNDTRDDYEQMMPSQRAQAQPLDKLALRARRAWDLPAARAQLFTPDQTDDAIVGLVVRLSEIRSKSDPTVFAIQWDRHIMRLEEVEAAVRNRQALAAVVASSGTPTTAALNAGLDDDKITENVIQQRFHLNNDDDPLPKRPRLDTESQHALFAAQKSHRGTGGPVSSLTASAATSSLPPDAPLCTETGPTNPSNEPFASYGYTIPQAWPKTVAPELPAVMSLYISASSAAAATATRAYHWPDAPVGAADMARFFSGVMQRVDTKEDRVLGFVMSYGWDDMCRWVEKGTQSERRAWALFLRDLERASQLGVGVWRCKLLVVGL